jgi:hypothetical protein
MNLDDLQSKLIAAAQLHPPSGEVPPGFERRVMTHLSRLLPVDHWSSWAQALWRAAAPCVGVALLLMAWSLLSGSNYAANSNLDLSQDFENTVLAAASMDQPATDVSR